MMKGYLDKLHVLATKTGAKPLNQTFTDISFHKRRGTQPAEKMAALGSPYGRQPTADDILGNAHELCKNIQEELCIEKIPRTVYVSSKNDNRSLKKLQNDFKRNIFDHKSFNKFIQSKDGLAYFSGVQNNDEKLAQQIEKAIKE